MDREAIRARFERIKERAFRKADEDLAGLGRKDARQRAAERHSGRGARRGRSKGTASDVLALTTDADVA
jgi:predicted component of type VI protein secretion system